MTLRPSDFGVDAIVLFNQGSWVMDPSFFVETGIEAWPVEGSAAVFFEEGFKVITTKLEEEAVRRYVDDVVLHKGNLREILTEMLKECKRVGINGRYLSAWAMKRYLPDGKEYVDLAEKLAKRRIAKGEEEVGKIRRAVDAAIEGFLDALKELREGMTECQFAGILNASMMEAGAQDRAFLTIVAFGENSALPHHTCSRRRLRKGDIVLVDFGARVGIYNSDLTRTFFFGEAMGVLAEAWELVEKAVERVLEEGRAGMSGRELDSLARELIDSDPRFKGKFIHSLGHCLGVEVHDPCSISGRSEEPLPEGAVFTVEPGIYLPGVGGVRLEEDVVAREGYLEVLSGRLPRLRTLAEYL